MQESDGEVPFCALVRMVFYHEARMSKVLLGSHASCLKRMEELESEFQSSAAVENSVDEEVNNPPFVVDGNSVAENDSTVAQHSDHPDVVEKNESEKSEAIDQSGKDQSATPVGNDENAVRADKSQSSSLIKHSEPTSDSIGLF